MKNPSIGFIGGGRVVRLFLEAWSMAGRTPSNIVIADPEASALERLKERYGSLETTPDASLAAAQDLVFLAIHPHTVVDALSGLRSRIRPEAILVSLAPKFTLARLSELLGGFPRLARANPNAPSLIGFGLNPIVFSPALSNADKELVLSLFAPLGESPEVAEEKIEAYALFTAMGPTYLWFQMQALRELAVSFGLNRAETDAGLKRMVEGAARTLVDSGLAPSEVMDLVPVRPLAEMEAQILELYRTRLPALFQKIRP